MSQINILCDTIRIDYDKTVTCCTVSYPTKKDPNDLIERMEAWCEQTMGPRMNGSELVWWLYRPTDQFIFADPAVVVLFKLTFVSS